MSEDEERGVTLRSSESNGCDEHLEAAIPSLWGLLEAIESFVELADITRTNQINKARGVAGSKQFIDSTMQECISNV